MTRSDVPQRAQHKASTSSIGCWRFFLGLQGKASRAGALQPHKDGAGSLHLAWCCPRAQGVAARAGKASAGDCSCPWCWLAPPANGNHCMHLETQLPPASSRSDLPMLSHSSAGPEMSCGGSGEPGLEVSEEPAPGHCDRVVGHRIHVPIAFWL